MNPTITLLAAVLTAGPAADPPAARVHRRAGGRSRGIPIKDATVGIHRPGAAEPQFTATTGADGKFKLGPLPPGAKYRSEKLFADAAGFGREYVWAPPVLPGATTTIDDILMTQGQEYTGQVLTDKGKPVPNARVRVQTLTWDALFSFERFGSPFDVFADAEGKYRLPPLPVGSVQLAVFAPSGRGHRSGSRSNRGSPGRHRRPSSNRGSPTAAGWWTRTASRSPGRSSTRWTSVRPRTRTGGSPWSATGRRGRRTRRPEGRFSDGCVRGRGRTKSR